MKNKKIILFTNLLLLTAVSFYSYKFVPKSFEFGGTSCYQGITVFVNRFVLEICSILSLISILTKRNVAKTLSILSTLIWILWGLFVNKSSLIDEFLYFIPLIIANILIIFVKFKIHNVEKI